MSLDSPRPKSQPFQDKSQAAADADGDNAVYGIPDGAVEPEDMSTVGSNLLVFETENDQINDVKEVKGGGEHLGDDDDQRLGDNDAKCLEVTDPQLPGDNDIQRSRCQEILTNFGPVQVDVTSPTNCPHNLQPLVEDFVKHLYDVVLKDLYIDPSEIGCLQSN